jgi:hypothetical protein
MWHGIPEYLAFAALVASLFHIASGRFVACTIAGAATCSILNLIHETWLAHGQVNLGWAPPMFIIGVIIALPACAAAGLPWMALRRRRKRTR